LPADKFFFNFESFQYQIIVSKKHEYKSDFVVFRRILYLSLLFFIPLPLAIAMLIFFMIWLPVIISAFIIWNLDFPSADKLYIFEYVHGSFGLPWFGESCSLHVNRFAVLLVKSNNRDNFYLSARIFSDRGETGMATILNQH